MTPVNTVPSYWQTKCTTLVNYEANIRLVKSQRKIPNREREYCIARLKRFCEKGLRAS